MWNEKSFLQRVAVGWCFVLLYAGAAWGASAGPPPDGDIDQLGGSAVNCAGTGWAVPVTKSVVLTAINLVDLDYDDCGGDDYDSISNPAGIKWVVGLTGTYGAFAGGDLGSPKTWTARAQKANNVGVVLQLKDDGVPIRDVPVDDPHLSVASLNLDLAVPTSATRAYQNDITCDPALYGYGKHYHWTAVTHACALDFSGLEFEETISHNWGTCTVISWSTGIGCTVGANNTVNHAGGDCNDYYWSCRTMAGCSTCTHTMTQDIWVAHADNVIVTKTVTFAWTRGTSPDTCALVITAP